MSLFGSPSILVAEDDADVRDVLALLLAQVSQDVELVLRGEDALERLSQRAYDLLICDIHMPDMNGIELCAIVKREQPKLSVMTISGFLSPENQGRLDELEVGFLAKPFTATQLFEALEAELNPKAQNTP